MPSILSQSISPTAIAIALKNGISVAVASASIPVTATTPGLVAAWATSTLQAALVSSGSSVQVKVDVVSLTPLVWQLTTSDGPINQ